MIGRFKVKDVRDLSTGFDSSQKDERAVLPSSSGHMITLTFERSVVSLRASGTEPKLKYYSEIVSPPDDQRFLLNSLTDVNHKCSFLIVPRDKQHILYNIQCICLRTVLDGWERFQNVNGMCLCNHVYQLIAKK